MALWTILELRWPRLAAHLAAYPEDVAKIRERKAPDHVPQALQPLFVSKAVIDVLDGRADEVNATLNEAAIRELLGLPSGKPH
jgi:hypothetical protein